LGVAAGLGSSVWPEVAASAGGCLLVVPVGSTEQHGCHLPLSTDTDISVALASRLVSARADAIMAPALPYGSSGEHAGFAGTLSIGTQALELVLVELGRSADAFAGVVFVSAHGGNLEALSRAVARLGSEGRRARWWSPGRGELPSGLTGDAHAGHTETSVMLALDGAAVRTAAAEPGNPTPLAELMPDLVAGGVRAVSANGVLGDPTGASAEAGRALLDNWSAELTAYLEGWP
jgi:mycofactocin precursor peptide peptidase